MLKIKDINTFYGDLQALWDVSLEVNQGELVALVGPNGAGKTTLMKTINGLLQPASGEILFQGIEITKQPVYEIVKMGISQVPEGGRIFSEMSVYENLELGAFVRDARKVRNETIETVFKNFPKLEERREQLGGTLSGGERQMLAIGRALMSRPKLLLLDEPSFGLAPILVDMMFRLISEINEQGTTILLVEQNVRAALELADRSYVIENGEIVGEGIGDDLLSFESIRSAYLG